MPQPMFYDDLMEEYILERLSATQKASFEAVLRQDADVLFEYRWQRDMIHCLQRYRKQELKHRLNGI